MDKDKFIKAFRKSFNKQMYTADENEVLRVAEWINIKLDNNEYKASRTYIYSLIMLINTIDAHQNFYDKYREILSQLITKIQEKIYKFDIKDDDRDYHSLTLMYSDLKRTLESLPLPLI